jgi:hypothetical protein
MTAYPPSNADKKGQWAPTRHILFPPGVDHAQIEILARARDGGAGLEYFYYMAHCGGSQEALRIFFSLVHQ